jgi:predicted RNA binding protein YcfA (HicA-like mRNA interferase family)
LASQRVGGLSEGSARDEAQTKATVLALHVIADRIEHGEAVPFNPRRMSNRQATRAGWVLRALQIAVWSIKRQSGSHRTSERSGSADYTFAFRDGDEIGPVMLTKIAKHTGFQPSDL